MNKQEILNLVESCQELTLPNGAKGAIWKDQLVEKIDEFFEPICSQVTRGIHPVYQQNYIRQMKSVLEKEFESFGCPSTEPCIVCNSVNTVIEPRFNYTVCISHFKMSPVEIQNYKDE